MPPTTNSDSEDDTDYVPLANDYDTDSHDEHDESETAATSAPLVVPAEQKKQRDALWASFQASVSTPPPNGNENGNGVPSSQPPVVKRVKIEKTYLFAGKHVTDVVEVPEDSDEAKKWPRWSPRPHPISPVSTPSSEKGKEKDGDAKSGSPAPHSAASGATAPTMTPTPGAKRSGPRKPRTTLPSIPKASQVKKITTLDKSAMDWRVHVASQSGNVKDELDANKRGGGYLEKVEFLKRVEDRREDVFEASKPSKRRKT